MRARDADEAGFTLVELIVALAVLATSLGIVSGALTSLAMEPEDPSAWPTRLKVARAHAINAGDAEVVWPDSAHVDPPALFLPDGRAVGATARAAAGSREGP
jgi:prepilin-type N-terminal cleavage/methylation domain-containing protein